MASKSSKKYGMARLTLAQAFAGLGLALLIVLATTATVISERISAIDDLARTTRDEILPDSAQHASAALTTERLMQLTMRLSYATTISERDGFRDQAAIVADLLMTSGDIHQKAAGTKALAAIQQATIAADDRDQRKAEIRTELKAMDSKIQKLASALASITADNEIQLKQQLEFLSTASNPATNPASSRLIQQIFTANDDAQDLLQNVRGARSLISRAFATEDQDKVSKIQALFTAHMDQVVAQADGLPTTNALKYLPKLVGDIRAANVIFDLREQQIAAKTTTVQNLNLATSTLTTLADELAAESIDLAAASATSILNGVDNIRLALASAGAALLVMVLLIGLMTRRLVILPIQRSVHVLAELGAGRTADPPPRASLKELNMLGDVVAKFANALRSMAEMKKQKSAAEEEEERNHAMRQEMSALANEFESTVMASVSQIGRSADELRQSSDFMSDAISATETLSHSSRDRAAEARENVDSVAAGSQQIASSIGEIETAASDAAQRSQRGADAAANAKASVSGLTDDANRIGEVVNLVSEITKRTNLLALNATIEAARSGEAGRGFAIVAGEVKQLAGQTAEAAHEIVEHVKRIRDGVTETSDHIEVIADVVASTSDMADMIASSVSQQAATTRSIADRAGGAAAANVEVADLIAQLNEKARSGNAVVEQVSIAANEIHDVADTLRTDVDGFITGLRARASG
jgi:methyl-accepting chemotaxis protein